MADQTLTDRLSGRSGGDEDPKGTLSVAERAQKFVDARQTLRSVEHYLSNDETPAPHLGTREDMIEAQKVLTHSAETHARAITPEEIRTAVASRDISPDLARDLLKHHPSDHPPRPTDKTHAGPEQRAGQDPDQRPGQAQSRQGRDD